jgi:hypothetical protein
MNRINCRSVVAVALLLGAACYRKRMMTTDCGTDKFPAPGAESRVTWAPTSTGGRLEGHIREKGKKSSVVRKASVLLPQPGGWDTLHVPVDSLGAFHIDSVAPGRHQIIVQARWYWAAFDTVEIRADSGLNGDVELKPTPQGWYACLSR